MPHSEDSRRYQAEVRDVYSGDDLILMVDLGLEGLYKKVRARLQGVDTPDAYQEEAGSVAGKLRDHVRTLTKSKNCIVDVHQMRRSGWIVTLYICGAGGEEVCLNQHLIDQGYIFKGGKV